MTTHRHAPLALPPVIDWLLAHRWDVEQNDPVRARREDLPGVWILHVDKGGRVRLQRRFYASAPQGMRRQRRGYVYYLHGEHSETIDISTTITALDDLPIVLGQMIGWALEPPFAEEEAFD